MGVLRSFLDGFYLIPNSDRPKWPIEGGFLVEIEEPYRRGRGLVFKGFRGQYQLGWGRPGSNPLPPLDVTPEEIGSWNPPPELPPYPLSPPADGLLYELLYPGSKMVYHLSSTRFRHNLVVKVKLDRANPEVDTVSDIWRTAEFHEREVYEIQEKLNDRPRKSNNYLTPNQVFALNS